MPCISLITSNLVKYGLITKKYALLDRIRIIDKLVCKLTTTTINRSVDLRNHTNMRTKLSGIYLISDS